MSRSLRAGACLAALGIVLAGCGRNSSAAFTGPWFDAKGDQVSPNFIQVDLGRRHCGSVAFMELGWPSGTRIVGNQFRSYIRDPQGLLGHQFGTLNTHARLPTGAVSTGFQHGQWKLWVVPSDDRFVYLVGQRPRRAMAIRRGGLRLMFIAPDTTRSC